MSTSNRCSGAACARARVLVLIIIAGVLAFIISAITPSDDERQHEPMRSAKVLQISIKSTKSISNKCTLPDTHGIAAAGSRQLYRRHAHYDVTPPQRSRLEKLAPAVTAVRSPPALWAFAAHHGSSFDLTS